MEAGRIVTCAALLWAAGFVGIGAFRGTTVGTHALAIRLVGIAGNLVQRMGSSELVDGLLHFGSISRVSDAASRWLGERGVPWSREECCGLLAACVPASLVVSVLVARSPLGMLAPGVAWLVGVPLIDGSLARKRAQALSEQMPGVFRTLATAMAFGETLAQAVTYVGDHEGGAAGSAFRSAALKLRCGVSVNEALDALVDELDTPGIGLIATALTISQRTGSPLRSLFQRSATLVERQGEFERMLAVKTAQVRLSVRIVSLLPVVMVGVLALISPDFQKGLTTVPGALSLVVATALDVVALGIIRHMMRGVL